jgi:hypothetical protein
MKMYAIIATHRGTPDKPQLYEAYEADAVGNNPMDLDSPARTGLAEALQEADVLEAAIVAVDLDDLVLLAALRRGTPTIGGVVTG